MKVMFTLCQLAFKKKFNFCVCQSMLRRRGFCVFESKEGVDSVSFSHSQNVGGVASVYFKVKEV